MIRYSRRSGVRCFTCGGWDNDPRKSQKRCVGFYLEVPGAILSYCTREEMAGDAPLQDQCDIPSWRHLHHADRPCYCGNQHEDGTGLGKPSSRPIGSRAPRGLPPKPELPDLDLPPLPTAPKPPKGPPLREWHANYVDERGQLLYQKRFMLDAKNRKVSCRWSVSCTSKRRIPYRLQGVLRALASGKPVDIVEGEICTQYMVRLGFQATTVRGCDCGLFRNASVRVWPDADETGYRKARQTVAQLLDVGAQVMVVSIPVARFQGYDVADYIRDGHTADDLNRRVRFATRLDEIREAV